MVQITNQELWTWNLLNNHVADAQAELQRAVGARDDYLAKLEGKYHAHFDPEKGAFIPRDGDKGGEAAKEVLTKKESKRK